VLGGIGVAMWLPVLDAMCNNNGTAFAAGEALPRPSGSGFGATASTPMFGRRRRPAMMGLNVSTWGNWEKTSKTMPEILA
jgi:hypothetical protein